MTRSLYAAPDLTNTNSYAAFVETIMGKPEYGLLVKILNLTRVIGTLKTTRLPELMKACPNLREFYTAQAAFTPAMMQVLPSLLELRILDLANCIERFEISRIINYCSDLGKLHTFRYPRCAVSTKYPIKRYPIAMRHLALRGGLRDEWLYKMAHYPPLSIETLLVAHAPSITAPPLLHLISSIATLRALTIAWPVMRFHEDSLDSVLLGAPNLTFLSLSIDYISPRFFENHHDALETLELKFSGVGKRKIVRPEDVMETLEVQAETDQSYIYPNLKVLGISLKLMNHVFEPDDRESLYSAASVRGVKVYQAQDVDEVTM